MSNYVKRFENLPESIMDWLKEASSENSCVIDSCVWQHKDDASVVYETKPANPEVYNYVVSIKSGYMEHLKFLDYLVKNKLEKITFLKNCITEK